jgi:chlorobactene glucosyltransferase
MITFQLVAAVLSCCLALLVTGALMTIFVYLRITESRAPSIPLDKTENLGERDSRAKPFVSIIITARNEEKAISKCISSLGIQTYANCEIIVVDDSSTDRTLQISQEFASRDSRIRAVEAGAKPNGWVGKSWACHRGFESSKGEILLFVDADSTFSPDTLELCLERFASGDYDMYSISPKIGLDGIWAHAVLPLLSSTINLLYPMIKVNSDTSKRAYVFGTFILVNRSVYEAIGGHEKVRTTLVEDAAIAANAKSGGFKLCVERGGGLITSEWETNFTAIYQGLERVFSDSIKTYGRASILNALTMFFLGLYPITFITGYVAIHSFQSPFAGSTHILLTVGFAASILSIALALLVVGFELYEISGSGELFSFLYPIGFVLYISAIITTVRKVFYARSFVWKGAHYEQRPQVSSAEAQ